MIWGYEDESTVVQTPAGARVTMTYDGTHMRRQREEGASTAKYLWDGAQILLETDAGDTTVARYTLAPFGYGDLLSQRRSNASSFYHFDAVGSTRALTAADQSTTDTYLYEAFGTLRTSTGSTTSPWRYVGRLGYLQESAVDGLLLRRRYYTPAVARLLSRDPLQILSVSPFAYADSRPTRSTDPSGLQVGADDLRRWGSKLGPIPTLCCDIVAAVQCAKAALGFASWADSFAENGFYPPLPAAGNGPQDAMRHCLWMCKLTRDQGPECANFAAYWNEWKECYLSPTGEFAKGGPGAYMEELREFLTGNPMDEANNARAISWAQDPLNANRSCGVLCLAKLTEGKLGIAPIDEWQEHWPSHAGSRAYWRPCDGTYCSDVDHTILPGW